MVVKYIQSQIEEIRNYKTLRWYGVFLSLVHVVTFFFWHHTAFVYQYIPKTANTLCWPQIPFCESLRFLSPMGVQITLFLYLALALLTVFLFLRKNTLAYAYWLFLFINVIKLYLFFMDYRLMGNYHYMPFVISFAYLFIRQKLFFIPILIGSFYFFAGVLKLSNFEWLTGLAFPKGVRFPFFFNEDIKMLLCFYVVCLEIIGTWLLILKTRWKMAAYFQFIIFHIMSYFIVDYFYPAVMLCLLSVFLLMYIFRENVVKLSIRNTFFGILFLSLVIAGNILSVFIPGDAALTGEGRYYGLNMYDANTECDSQIFLRFKNKTIQESFSAYREYSMRIQCEPYVDFNTVSKICSYYKSDPDFIDMDWSLYSKLGSDLSFQRIVNERDVCSKNLQYSSWKKNKWIKVEK